MRIPYRPFDDPDQLPLIRAGIDALEYHLKSPDEDCLDSFNDAITWNRISSEAGLQGSEIIFVGDSGRIYVVLCAYDKGVVSCRYLDVEKHTAGECDPLSGLIHTVMAPAFTPGFAGIDWDDVSLTLGSGKTAQLAVASGYPEEALSQLDGKVGLDKGKRIVGLILTVFMSEDEFSLPVYKRTSRMLKSVFAYDGPTLIAFPAIRGKIDPWLGVLTVHA